MSEAQTSHQVIAGVITHLNAAISNARLYSAAHPQVRRYLERAYAELSQVLRARAELTFMIVDHDLVVDNQPMVSKTPQVAQFVQLLTRGAVERLTFSSGVTLEELTQLVGDLATDEQTAVRSTPGITLGKG